MRSFARGSDGLAEISQDDAANVVIPVLDDDSRQEIKQVILSLNSGRNTIKSLTKTLQKAGRLPYSDPERRPSHIALV
jgi:type I restriction enzyme M protein